MDLEGRHLPSTLRLHAMRELRLLDSEYLLVGLDKICASLERHLSTEQNLKENNLPSDNR